MDQASLAFCLTQPVVRSSLYDSVEFLGLPLNKLNVLCDRVVENCAYQLQSSTLDNNNCDLMSPNKQSHYVVFLSGPSLQVISAQRSILKKYPSEASVLYKFICNDTLASDGVVKSEFHRKIEDIMRLRNVIIEFPDSDTRSDSTHSQLNSVYISIQGKPDDVEGARIELVTMIAAADGLHVEEFGMPTHLINIVCGVKKAFLKALEKETHTKIHLPRYYGNLLDTHSLDQHEGKILIVGEESNTVRAVESFLETARQAERTLITRQFPLQPRKLDWLPILKYQDLLNVMEDNGTSIIFPSANSKKSSITIYGQSEHEISRTIKGVTHMTSDVFSGWLWLENNIPSSQPIQLPAQHQLNELIFNICKTSGAEIKYQNYCFEISGQPDPLKDALKALEREFAFKLFQKECKTQIELASDHREFISGKKNGKVNKIMKITNVKIGFENSNEYTFFINVYSPQCSKTLSGLELLQEELPAELSFFVPEAYHKRIIGVGGKNIQRIMKQFGVYVKFSTAEEFTALGASVDSGDNVVARTPAKNVINLFNFKQAILDMIENGSKDKEWYSDPGFSTRAVSPHLMPSSLKPQARQESNYPHHSYDINEANNFSIAQETGVEEVHIRLSLVPKLMSIIESEYFEELTRQIKYEFNITLVASKEFPPLSMIHNSNELGSCTFVFQYERRDAQKLPQAQQLLADFLEASQTTSMAPVGFSVPSGNDPAPRRSSHSVSQPISDFRSTRDTRSYSLFDIDVGGVFESNTQRRNTYTSLNVSQYQQPQTINQSPYQHRRLSSTPLDRSISQSTPQSIGNIWNSHDGATMDDSPLQWLNNNVSRTHIKNNPKLNYWPESDQTHLQFQTPGPIPTNNSSGRGGRRGPSSFYSGYYGF
ncbi:hypothetical protein K7432_014451 [Basidiobolus ranarum]|uniref:K Homology domain-containing protein n=1 Tax=Basidiobolus ranarum TaxID=34480 RepID=A0ABR2VQE7_9FUNG